MPYTCPQCAAFGARASRGESVPKDWRDYCRGKQCSKGKKKGKKGLVSKARDHRKE